MLSRRDARRAVEVVAAVLAIAVVLGVVLSRGTPEAPSARGAHLRAHRSTATTTVPTHPPLRGMAVDQRAIPLVDTRRQVVSNGAVLAPVRSLPTTVWAPTTLGRYPLVVFVHGFDRGPPTYARFCATLASAGYVVAAPSFPLEDPDLGFALDRDELPAEATDVSFVITSLEQGAMASEIVPGEVAVVGHSDGADVALMIGDEAGTVDPRVRAIVADAPDPIARPVVASSAPLLLVQGTADTVVPYSASRTVFTQVGAPTFYLSLIGADHLPPIQGGSSWTPVLDAAVADFLDATVAGRGPGRTALAGQLSSLPLATLETAR